MPIPHRPPFVALLALGALLALAGPGTGAQPVRPVVYVVPVDGVIDLGLAPFIQRTIDEAAAARAAAVVLDIDTFGGRVDAAVAIRDALLRSPVRTVAFVNKRAISAGALISLAATTIAMAEGGSIGAATPVEAGPGGPAQPVAEKTVSYLRTEFRSTAEVRNRRGDIAEAMVDADIEIADLSQKGKLLTLTTGQALELKLADARANTLEDLLAALDLGDAEVRTVQQTWAETLVRALTHPVFSSLLMAVGVLGIIIEIQTPGFGVPGGLGLVALGLFFWGHWLVMLAGWEELLLVGIGLLLLVIEIFITPGFGAAGLLGTAALVAGLGLSLVGAGAAWEAVLIAIGRVAGSLMLALVGAAALLGAIPRLPFGRRLVLQETLTAEEGFESTPASDRRWIGKRGIAVSPLRPSGIAAFDGERVDVVSEGVYIEAGAAIDVIHVDGNRIVVRQARAGSPEGADHGT
jgi:membrane-bound serine protease (ClpP class)